MLIPAGYRILVKQDEVEKVSKGGIVLAMDEKLERAAVTTGTVKAVGPDAWRHLGSEAWCKVGDRIMFSKYSFKTITDPDTEEQFILMNDEDVICIIK